MQHALTAEAEGADVSSTAALPDATRPDPSRPLPRAPFGRDFLRMLLDPDQPLFLKWRYLPRLAPWLGRFLSHATDAHARHRAAATAGMISETLADHQALSEGTGAERWIVPSDYLYVYKDRAAFEGDALPWDIRRNHGVVGGRLQRMV